MKENRIYLLAVDVLYKDGYFHLHSKLLDRPTNYYNVLKYLYIVYMFVKLFIHQINLIRILYYKFDIYIGTLFFYSITINDKLIYGVKRFIQKLILLHDNQFYIP